MHSRNIEVWDYTSEEAATLATATKEAQRMKDDELLMSYRDAELQCQLFRARGDVNNLRLWHNISILIGNEILYRMTEEWHKVKHSRR